MCGLECFSVGEGEEMSVRDAGESTGERSCGFVASQ